MVSQYLLSLPSWSGNIEVVPQTLKILWKRLFVMSEVLSMSYLASVLRAILETP